MSFAATRTGRGYRRALLRLAVVAAPAPPLADVQILPTFVGAAVAKADANTSQWQDFKARLDANLDLLLNVNYQADELSWISDYALGYQCLKDSDPDTASKYADKALAMMSFGLNANQRVDGSARIYLGRGDGVTTAFVLPDATAVTATLDVYLADVVIYPVVKGAANGQDAVNYYTKFVKVSDSSDGTADYTEGVDWQRNNDYLDLYLDWSLGGVEPAPAATYYVTAGSHIFATKQTLATGYTYNAGTQTVTFAVAPAASKLVFAQYQYGTWTGGATTLGYRQTEDGYGGYNNVFIDSTYTSRYLGKHLATGLDWLDGYAGFSAPFKAEVIDVLKRWVDYLAVSGYKVDQPASNYAQGSWVSLVLTAIALTGRDGSAAGYQSDAQTWRTDNLLVTLAAPATAAAMTYKGGFWAEGWTYGPLATENLLIAGMALEEAGLADNAAEGAWAAEVMNHLIQAQPYQTATQLYPSVNWQVWGAVYDTGDGSVYPFPFPIPARFLAIISSASSDATAAAYARFARAEEVGLAHPEVTAVSDWADLLFFDPDAAVTDWGSSPALGAYAEGCGLLLARNAWDYASAFATFQAGNSWDHLGHGADHLLFAQGHTTLWRGEDNLLVTGSSALHDQEVTAQDVTYGSNKSSYCNLVITDDNGDDTQRYRWSQPAFWYGPGVSLGGYVAVKAHELAAAYAHATADTLAAYTGPFSADNGGVLSECVRGWLFVRPDLLFVYDRVTSRSAAPASEYPKQQRWHVEGTPTVTTPSLSHTRGGSKLFGKFFGAQASTLTLQQTVVGTDGQWAHTVSQVVWQNDVAAARVTYLAVFQAAASGAGAMDATSHVTATGLEGALCGQTLVLFGSALTGDGVAGYRPALPASYSYTAPGGTLTHIVCDLVASTNYTLGGDASGVVASSAAGVLTFTTSGAGAQTVTVT